MVIVLRACVASRRVVLRTLKLLCFGLAPPRPLPVNRTSPIPRAPRGRGRPGARGPPRPAPPPPRPRPARPPPPPAVDRPEAEGRREGGRAKNFFTEEAHLKHS